MCWPPPQFPYIIDISGILLRLCFGAHKNDNDNNNILFCIESENIGVAAKATSWGTNCISAKLSLSYPVNSKCRILWYNCLQLTDCTRSSLISDEHYIIMNNQWLCFYIFEDHFVCIASHVYMDTSKSIKNVTEIKMLHANWMILTQSSSFTSQFLSDQNRWLILFINVIGVHGNTFPDVWGKIILILHACVTS